ncbi:MAG: cell wall-binding repeat-containing protein [Coriobacteriia bacterium]|nr:cell wall-binding repeat-containing protein [Coriobacteriia bacterium]
MHTSTSLPASLLRVVLTCLIVAGLAFPTPAAGAVIARDAGSAEPASPLRDSDDARIPPGVSALADPQSAVTAPSGDYRIDALLSGYYLSGTSVTYSFYENDVFGGSYYGSETGVGEVSEAVKTNVRQIMAWYGSIMDVEFTEVAETSSVIGIIRFMVSSAPAYAYSYYPQGTSMFYVASDVHLNPAYDRLGDLNGFRHPPGMHGYATLIHEIGHALGLKHPFEPVGSRTTVLPAAEDNTTNSVMSYTCTGRSPATAMTYDVTALQYMYGARERNAGDETYVFTSVGTGQHTVGGATFFETPYLTKQTIWDSGGIDTLDASLLPVAASGYRLDLRGGGWLIGNSQSLGTSFDHGSTLAVGSVIENVVNSGSDDTIYANSAANTFGGYSLGRAVGDDWVLGATAVDTLDLAGYRPSGVAQQRVGDNLVIGLQDRGSVTIAGYYTGSTPAIVYGANTPPVAAAEVSSEGGRAPFALTASGAASSDPDGALATYAWEFGDGGTATGSVAQHVYAEPGEYTVRLMVTDDDGATAQASAQVTVLPTFSVQALAGVNRYETAVQVSQNAFPGGADAVVIATGRNWPDALGGTSLAGALGAPVLLVDTHSVPSDVMAEIARLGASSAIILGGEGAVGAAVEDALAAELGSVNVERIGGANRYITADLVAARTRAALGSAWDGTAFVATGANFPDALAAAPLAAAQGWPLYLAHPASGLSDVTKAAMAGVTDALVLGGEAVVTPVTKSYLEEALGPSHVTRLAGSDRYKTSVTVATYAVTRAGHTWDGVGITTGQNFPDALAGGVLQSVSGSVMLLTPSTALSADAAAALAANKGCITSVTFYGGASAVSDVVRAAVVSALQ